MKLMHLKSGTDVRGVAVATEKYPEIQLTDEVVREISASFIDFLCEKKGKTADELLVSVGHDSRISADRIRTAVIDILVNMGVNVLNCSYCSTPAMFMTTVTKKCDGAIQITASHHPFDRNGLKFFTRDGGLSGDELKAILADAENEPQYKAEKNGTITEIDYISEYAEILRNMIKKGVNAEDYEKPLKDFKIAVDAGNGVGGFYATKVLAPLGADVSASQFLEPDGMFPNHIPNPENEDAMKSVCEAVVKNKADLGIIFDTDVDRAGCVDNSGVEINRNRLIALASAIVCQDNPNATIVTDSVTSDGLKAFIEDNLGGKHYRYKRGYKNVIDMAKSLCEQGINCPLAIETSGHAALRENYFLDDGAYLVTRIVIELAKGTDIDKLLEPLATPVESEEFRFSILTDDFKEYGEKVFASLENFVSSCNQWKLAEDNREGLRVCVPNGWFLLRLSVHDPVMPMNIESNVVGGVKKTVAQLRGFFRQFDKLDTNSF